LECSSQKPSISSCNHFGGSTCSTC
jgi:hypothetical protein